MRRSEIKRERKNNKKNQKHVKFEKKRNQKKKKEDKRNRKKEKEYWCYNRRVRVMRTVVKMHDRKGVRKYRALAKPTLLVVICMKTI